MATLAQTNEELFREYQFNFNPPGARANGMGGAFIGVADDATSSFSNPAGLAFLAETALTFEYRVRNLDASTGEIDGRFITTTFDQAAQSLNGSFLSLNLTYRGFYFGLFQYDFLDESQARTFQSRSLSNGIETIELRDILLDLTGTTRGIGVARRFGRFKVGATVNHLSMDGRTNYELVSFQRPVFQETVYESSIDDRDTAWGYSLGLHHEYGTKFSWGVVWRDNPRFNLISNVLQRVNGQPDIIDEQLEVPFIVPDVFGLGLRYRPRPTVSLMVDLQNIFYSQIISDDFVIIEGLGEDTREDYNIDDTTELHMGFEWLIPGNRNVYAIRGGYYRNPLHAVTYSGDDEATRDRFAGIGLTDEDHFTFGLGWVYRNRIELDISANLWENGSEYTTSFIWRKK
ncbi:MAG: hypothetical protein QNK37_16880 [Acidobacteriota bacterium]|nr:hypothetical protein [Acidobacteriota bacterium]